MNPSTLAPRTRPRIRTVAITVAIVVLALGLLLASGTLGSRMFSPATLLDAIVAFDPQNDAHLLIVHNRLPRTALAVLVGVALGTAGVVMQSLTRNPLAEPGLLGVNAGAAVAVAASITLFGVTQPAVYMIAALIGAGVAGAAVLLLGGVRRGTDPIRLVLAGAALAVVLGALAQILVVNADDMLFDRYRNWMVGSLQGRGVDVLVPAAALIVLGLVLALLLSRALDAAALGPELSRALGARPGRVWTLAGACVVLLAGAATAAAGPIVFVGLIAPHIARALVGNDHRRMLPVAAVFAALLMLVADVLGRVVALPGEVGVGIMAAIIGGPFFVAIVRHRRMALL